MQNDNIKSALKLDNLFFDEISFSRIGFQNENKPKLSMEISIGEDINSKHYRTTLKFTLNKEDEYIVNVTAIGIFEFSGNVDEETKKDLIQKNSVSIMMPYVRSEISLITAQPGVETVVLPPFNINNMINRGTKEN